MRKGGEKAMRIRCDSCGKSYDNQKDEFCPNCGAYNEPLKGKGTLKDTYSHTLSEPKKAAVPRPVRPSKSQMPKPVKPKRKRPAAIGIFLIIALGAGFQLVNIFLADRDVKPDLDAQMCIRDSLAGSAGRLYGNFAAGIFG